MERQQQPEVFCHLFHSGTICGKGEEVIGAKPNLYCEAIELVCGGSPKICVLVDRKALDRAFTKPPLHQESRLTGSGSPNLVVLVE